MTKNAHISRSEYASCILAVLAMLFTLRFHLLPALIAGLLVYELVHVLSPAFARHISTRRAKAAAIIVVSLIVVGAVSAASFGIVVFMKGEGGSLSALLAKMADIIEDSRSTLPVWIAEFLPTTAQGVRDTLSLWLREHASELQSIGKETGHALAQVLIGMVIGAMVSLRDALGDAERAPLARALAERVFHLGEAFRRIVFAQVRISALNTFFTAIYLVGVLPLFGVHLPLTKTMVVVTFLAGLLPVIGNLISNSVIVIVSMAHSPQIAFSSLGFLVIIHKLEYFLNARIIGARIHAAAWELLTVMLVMETLYGIPGVIAGPIFYAYVKRELSTAGLV